MKLLTMIEREWNGLTWMSRYVPRVFRTTAIFAAVILMIVLVGSAGSVINVAALIRSPSVAALPSPFGAGTVSTPATVSDIGLARLVIRPSGFDPTEVRLQHRRTVFAISNRSGLDQIILRFRSESGGLQREVRIPKEQPNWRGVIELPVGRFVITEVNHPDWVCSIVVAE